MITFREPTIEDKPWMDECIHRLDSQNCELCFGNIFVWSFIYGTKIYHYKDFLLTKSANDDGEHDNVSYSFPAGKGDLKEALELLLEDANECGHPFRIYGINETTRRLLEEAMPGKFDYEDVRDGYDYIYKTEDLIHLSGKKYHGKRNHIASFKKTYDWSYEEITQENIRDCLAMNIKWEEENRLRNPEEIDDELLALHRAFANYDALGFRGGLLRVDGDVVAFTMGEHLNHNTFCTHFEKAFAGIRGAYPMINQQFAERTLSSYEYINREEDVGAEGLRKAKLSYHPAILLEKSVAVYKG